MLAASSTFLQWGYGVNTVEKSGLKHNGFQRKECKHLLRWGGWRWVVLSLVVATVLTVTCGVVFTALLMVSQKHR
jgi:hypothetical protein